MSSPARRLAGILATTQQTKPAEPKPAKLSCRACGIHLDPILADVGLHVGCVDPDPPSIVGELRQMLIDHDAASARSTQVAIGPSEIGTPCDRRLGYRLHSTPTQPDRRVPWAPIQGTAVHTYIADVFTAVNARLGYERYMVEKKVWPDDMICGSCDWYDTVHQQVRDWKLVGKTRSDIYRRKGPSPEYVVQAHLYGLGWHRAGHPVRDVGIVFLPRDHDYDKAWEWSVPFDRDLAESALDRLYRVSNLLSDLKVDEQPALWAAVPAKPTDDCRYCPYFRPGSAADGTGCPGDPAAQQRRVDKFTNGLIA
jgi:hypothetical protein